jgi:hypothetical protein
MKGLAKNWKALVAVCLISGLVGCAIEREEINACIEVCASNGGMKNIQDSAYGPTCRCVNGLMKTM